jgi:hypothetical protein
MCDVPSQKLLIQLLKKSRITGLVTFNSMGPNWQVALQVWSPQQLQPLTEMIIGYVTLIETVSLSQTTKLIFF